MNTFTVTLTSHNYSISFPTEEFIKSFPNSLITLALQSKEKDIPIENPIVTSDILEHLLYIIKHQDYPYIDVPNAVRSSESYHSVRKILDYLGIDLPDFIYTFKYEQWRRLNPDFTFRDLDKFYYSIMRYCIDVNCPDLANYVIDHTSDRNLEDDVKIIQEYILTGPSYDHLPYTEGVDTILPILIRKKQLIPKIYNDRLLRRIASLGYIQLLDELYPYASKESKSEILYNAINGIHSDPVHLTEHIRMIYHIADRYWNDIYQHDFQLINSVIDGSFDVTPGKFGDLHQKGIHIIVLLYLTILTDRESSFDYIYARTSQHEKNCFIAWYFKCYPDLLTIDRLYRMKHNIPLEFRWCHAHTLIEVGYPDFAYYFAS